MKNLILLCLLSVGLNLFAQNLYFPPILGDQWETTDPVTLNWCPEKIDSLYAFLEEEQSKSFILLKDGKIVLERYFEDYEKDSLWVWFSAGKSLTAMLVGIAQEEEFLNINDKSSDYLGVGWTSLSPDQEAAITIRHQLTMTTGLDETEFFCTDPDCLTYVADAGSHWVYHNSPYSLLRNVLEEATSTNLNIYTNQKIKNKTGMDGFWLPVGFNNFYFSTARSMARYGLLVQNQGVWNGNTVLGDTSYVNQMISPSQDLNPSYGYLWWLNGQESYIGPDSPQSIEGMLAPDAPEDIVTAAGAQGQFISISPAEGLVMIRQGTAVDNDLTGIPLLNNIWKRILDLDCTTAETRPVVNNAEINLYPNPATDQIQFTGFTERPFSIVVYDVLGNVVLEERSSLEINVKSLIAGSYWVTIIREGAKEVLRFEKL